jgi:hypothetical protein
MNENFQIFYIYPPEKQLFGFSELHVINNDNEELDVLTTQALELAQHLQELLLIQYLPLQISRDYYQGHAYQEIHLCVLNDHMSHEHFEIKY